MSGGHAHGLFVHRASRVHALAPHCKVVAVFAFVVIVSLTPRDLVGVFAAYAAALAAVAVIAGVRLRFILRRLVIEIPFVAFLLVLPFIAEGETTKVFGFDLSVEGVWVAWNATVKATLGLAALVLLGATTQATELLRGLERLGMPRILLAIAGFMIRYADVVTGELRRMRTARAARGENARWLWQTKALASTLGSLFIRSFERGERVYTSMLSRGFDGSVPTTTSISATPARHWVVSMLLPVSAAAIALAGVSL